MNNPMMIMPFYPMEGGFQVMMPQGVDMSQMQPMAMMGQNPQFMPMNMMGNPDMNNNQEQKADNNQQ